MRPFDSSDRRRVAPLLRWRTPTRPGAARRGLAAHRRRGGPLLPLCARKKKVVKKMAVVTLRPSFPDAPPSSSRRRRKPAPFFRREEKPPSFSLYFTTQTTHCTYSASEKEVFPHPPPPWQRQPLLPSILRIGRRERSFHITTKQCVRGCRCSIVCCIEILFPAHENETGRGLGCTPACKILTSEEETHRTFFRGRENVGKLAPSGNGECAGGIQAEGERRGK